MPRIISPRRFLSLGLTLGLLVVATPASAGPISKRFQEWSASRQAKAVTQTSKSRPMTDLNVGRTSFSQSIQQHLPGRFQKENTTTHSMKTVPVKHNKGMLVPGQ